MSTTPPKDSDIPPPPDDGEIPAAPDEGIPAAPGDEAPEAPPLDATVPGKGGQQRVAVKPLSPREKEEQRRGELKKALEIRELITLETDLTALQKEQQQKTNEVNRLEKNVSDSLRSVSRAKEYLSTIESERNALIDSKTKYETEEKGNLDQVLVTRLESAIKAQENLRESAAKDLIEKTRLLEANQQERNEKITPLQDRLKVIKFEIPIYNSVIGAKRAQTLREGSRKQQEQAKKEEELKRRVGDVAAVTQRREAISGEGEPEWDDENVVQQEQKREKDQTQQVKAVGKVRTTADSKEASDKYTKAFGSFKYNDKGAESPTPLLKLANYLFPDVKDSKYWADEDAIKARLQTQIAEGALGTTKAQINDKIREIIGFDFDKAVAKRTENVAVAEKYGTKLFKYFSYNQEGVKEPSSLQKLAQHLGVRVQGDVTPAQIKEIQERLKKDLENARLDVAGINKIIGYNFDKAIPTIEAAIKAAEKAEKEALAKKSAEERRAVASEGARVTTTETKQDQESEVARLQKQLADLQARLAESEARAAAQATSQPAAAGTVERKIIAEPASEKQATSGPSAPAASSTAPASASQTMAAEAPAGAQTATPAGAQTAASTQGPSAANQVTATAAPAEARTAAAPTQGSSAAAANQATAEPASARENKAASDNQTFSQARVDQARNEALQAQTRRLQSPEPAQGGQAPARAAAPLKPLQKTATYAGAQIQGTPLKPLQKTETSVTKPSKAAEQLANQIEEYKNWSLDSTRQGGFFKSNQAEKYKIATEIVAALKTNTPITVEKIKEWEDRNKKATGYDRTKRLANFIKSVDELLKPGGAESARRMEAERAQQTKPDEDKGPPPPSPRSQPR